MEREQDTLASKDRRICNIKAATNSSNPTILQNAQLHYIRVINRRALAGGRMVDRASESDPGGVGQANPGAAGESRAHGD